MPTALDHRRWDRMNLGILAAQTAVWASCLTLAPRIQNPVGLAALVVFFCLMMQGVFSMMHESFHRHAHHNPAANYAMGWLASTLFGAANTLIWINHLGHHVRNRTRAELVDYVEPGQSVAKKAAMYYFAIAGGIWLAGFAGSLILTVMPPGWTRVFARKSRENTYAAAFADFQEKDFRRIRLETVAAIVFWAGVWLTLGWRWQDVLLFYGAFALSWSSLQWIYHVRTPLDPIEGTYNVRTLFPIRWLFLNFSYNLTHHRQPGLRWQLLHQATDLRETRPLWHTWLSILQPPRLLPPPGTLTKTYF